MQSNMVEREKIRWYAQKLANQANFLARVLYYVATNIHYTLLNSEELGNDSLDEIIIDRHQILSLERHFADYLNKPDFWEICAEQILSQLEAWQTEGKRPDGIGRGIFATFIRDPDFPEDETEKLSEVRDRYAADAADLLLQQIEWAKDKPERLKEILGVNIIKAKVKEAASKLSKQQRTVLLKVHEETKQGQNKPVLWKPAQWFGEQTDSERAALSRALKKLEERGLIVRKSSKQKGVPKRTAYVELTDTGHRAVKMLIGSSKH